jgi:hypothetical protein
MKRLEFKQGDDPTEVARRIAQDNKLSKDVENAIEYNLRKVMEQVE